MPRITLNIAGQEFELARSADADELRREMLAAVHSGGGFVSFPISATETLSVLVSPGVHVALGTVIEPADAVDVPGWGNESKFLDDIQWVDRA